MYDPAAEQYGCALAGIDYVEAEQASNEMLMKTVFEAGKGAAKGAFVGLFTGNPAKGATAGAVVGAMNHIKKEFSSDPPSQSNQ